MPEPICPSRLESQVSFAPMLPSSLSLAVPEKPMQWNEEAVRRYAL